MDLRYYVMYSLILSGLPEYGSDGSLQCKVDFFSFLKHTWGRLHANVIDYNYNYFLKS